MSQLTCDQARKRMLCEQLSDEEEDALSRHLEQCQSCEAEFAGTDLSALAAWEVPEPSPDLARRTVERLTSERSSVSWWRRFWQAADRAVVRFASHRATPATGFATVMVFLLLLVPVLSPHWARGRSSGSVSGCKVNLRVLGGALESYAKDHQGRYPQALSELSPDYVREFPECPQAGRDTYGPGYQLAQDSRHFTLACKGEHHRDAGLSSDQPAIQR